MSSSQMHGFLIGYSEANVAGTREKGKMGIS